jgi:uncharacterized protein YdaU (DUF1376 family)
MHYYQFNIGDYQSHTSHLSEMEDLIYRRLLDWYYLHECPIPLDESEVSRQIRMRSHTESIAIVLREYFERTNDGWIHHRANKEIAKADEKSEKASASAKVRWSKKDANALPPLSESNATHNTLPITQDTEHKTQKKKATAVAFVLPDWIEKETWDAFIQMRKRIGKPPTDYALKLIIDKLTRFRANGQDVKQVLEKSITSSWQDVFEIKANPVDIVRQTVPMSKEPDPALEKIKADEKKAAPMPDHIRKYIAEVVRKA